MEKHVKGDFNNQLRERSITLAVNLHTLLQKKKSKSLERSTVYQLIRSSTSVAANFRAATRARSDAEFYSKICIVVEECDETLFWIDFLIRIEVFITAEIEDIRNETEQLLKIFSSIHISQFKFHIYYVSLNCP